MNWLGQNVEAEEISSATSFFFFFNHICPLLHTFALHSYAATVVAFMFSITVVDDLVYVMYKTHAEHLSTRTDIRHHL